MKDSKCVAEYQFGGGLLPQASDGRRITVNVEVNVSNRRKAIHPINTADVHYYQSRV